MKILPSDENPFGSIQAIVRVLGECDSFLLTPHTRCDGDSICSMGALGLALKRMGKNVFFITNEKVPDEYGIFPFTSQFSQVLPQNFFDCVILMECTRQSRITDGVVSRLCDKIVINLDHHRGNAIAADHHYIDYNASSLCEIVFELICAMGVVIDDAIAQALYTGILTDTGGFLFSNTTSKTFSVLTELLKIPFEPYKLARKILKSAPLTQVRFRGELMHHFQTNCASSVVWTSITQKLLSQYDLRYDMLQNMTEALNIVADCVIFILFKEETDNLVSVSLRSNDDLISVRELAQRYGGGGHNAAAGCTLPGTLADVRETILREVDLLLSANNNAE